MMYAIRSKSFAAAYSFKAVDRREKGPMVQ
jgi:hypothetical protein